MHLILDFFCLMICKLGFCCCLWWKMYIHNYPARLFRWSGFCGTIQSIIIKNLAQASLCQGADPGPSLSQSFFTGCLTWCWLAMTSTVNTVSSEWSGGTWWLHSGQACFSLRHSARGIWAASWAWSWVKGGCVTWGSFFVAVNTFQHCSSGIYFGFSFERGRTFLLQLWCHLSAVGFFPPTALGIKSRTFTHARQGSTTEPHPQSQEYFPFVLFCFLNWNLIVRITQNLFHPTLGDFSTYFLIGL
jgi:hypothetical protein